MSNFLAVDLLVQNLIQCLVVQIIKWASLSRDQSNYSGFLESLFKRPLTRYQSQTDWSTGKNTFLILQATVSCLKSQSFHLLSTFYKIKPLHESLLEIQAPLCNGAIIFCQFWTNELSFFGPMLHTNASIFHEKKSSVEHLRKVITKHIMTISIWYIVSNSPSFTLPITSLCDRNRISAGDDWEVYKY